jgi:hypothetical protein
MECGVHLDICAAGSLADPAMIRLGKELLEREVAMLTRLSQSQGKKVTGAKVGLNAPK